VNQNNDRLHILMLTNVVAPDKLGGLERYVRELSAELVRQGHKVTVLSKRTQDSQLAEEQCADGVRVVRYNVPSKRDPLFVLKYPYRVIRGVSSALRAERGSTSVAPTVIHGHFPLPVVCAMAFRLPYIYTCHAPVYKEILDERADSYRLPRWMRGAFVESFKMVERLVISSAAQVVTLSDFVAGEVVELTGQPASNIARIPGGLDTGWFRPDSKTVHQEPSSGPILFTARRLVSRTGVEELINAMPMILERYPSAKLAIAGDGPLKARLHGAVREQQLSGSVSFLGRVSEAELRSEYRRADIAVTPTRNLEGFGLSTVEAMSCGTVALVTPVAANPEVAGRLSPLLVAPSPDPQGIAEGVLALWESPDFQPLRASVRSAVHPRLSWPEVCRSYLGLYSEVSGADRGPGGSAVERVGTTT
jgi:glycosyltransferase involved in cell wall biosynthesis